MIKIFLFLLFVLFVNCNNCHLSNDMIIVKNVFVDEYNITASYYFDINGVYGDFYVVDKAGIYRKGDTLFISSLKK